MKNPSNHDLHIMLTRIEERQIGVVEKLEVINIWQQQHEKKDEERFNNLNKYAASIAIVASAIGAGASWLWHKLTGQA